jgi:formylglycine-generating enzyme required for sulfatase activity
MALIPAGTITMGNCMTPSEGYSDELGLHTLNVSAFHMDKYEVSWTLWLDVYNWAITNGYVFDNAGPGKGANHPVHSVSWYDAVKWCNARSERENRTPAYYTSGAQTTVYRSGQVDIQNDWVKWNTGYRLSTEAEWEKAARGGAAGHRFPWADVEAINQSRANYYASPGDFAYDVNTTSGYHPTFNDGVSPYTSPVGYFSANANGYGLYDMAGNVWEWCWDWYDSAWYGSTGATQSDTRGPVGPGSARVIRGGSWGSRASFCRSAIRGRINPSSWGYGLGFRCVLPPGQ